MKKVLMAAAAGFLASLMVGGEARAQITCICGDDYCDFMCFEDMTCPQDCGGMGECGDGYCDVEMGEDVFSCFEDCTCSHYAACDCPGADGACVTVCVDVYCGDGECAYPENHFNCPSDCPTDLCCGDYYCAYDETPGTCPNDCDWCGNGYCGPYEDEYSCPSDCAPVGCGDGFCDIGMAENTSDCPQDCWCGDGVCDDYELVMGTCWTECGGCNDNYICEPPYENEFNCGDCELTDSDGDGNTDVNEHWNGSDPWMPDPAPDPAYDVGCYFWGKSDGGPFVQPGDINTIQTAYVGGAVDYSTILPSSYDPLDLDRSGFPDPPDIAIAQGMYVGASVPGGYASSPAALTVTDAPSAAVAEGSTTHITVSVAAQGPGTVLYSSGFSVVFWVTSGNAVLLGGEGTAPGEPAGNRYDVSMDAASGALANIVVLVTGPGPVVVDAKVPACGEEPVGRWCGEVQLASPVVINGP